MVNSKLGGLRRRATFAWRRYLDDLARMLVGDFEVTPDHREERDPWGR
jgi:hypothetical protein